MRRMPGLATSAAHRRACGGPRPLLPGGHAVLWQGSLIRRCGRGRRYLDILENMEGRVQRYYYKREPRQLIPRLEPNESLNAVVRSEDRCAFR